MFYSFYCLNFTFQNFLFHQSDSIETLASHSSNVSDLFFFFISADTAYPPIIAESTIAESSFHLFAVWRQLKRPSGTSLPTIWSFQRRSSFSTFVYFQNCSRLWKVTDYIHEISPLILLFTPEIEACHFLILNVGVEIMTVNRPSELRVMYVSLNYSRQHLEHK